MRIALLALAASLALPALPAMAYENFIPLGKNYAPGDENLPALGSEQDRVNTQIDIYETEIYLRNMRAKSFDSLVNRLRSDQQPGDFDANHIDY